MKKFLNFLLIRFTPLCIFVPYINNYDNTYMSLKPSKPITFKSCTYIFFTEHFRCNFIEQFSRFFGIISGPQSSYHVVLRTAVELHCTHRITFLHSEATCNFRRHTFARFSFSLPRGVSACTPLIYYYLVRMRPLSFGRGSNAHAHMFCFSMFSVVHGFAVTLYEMN